MSRRRNWWHRLTVRPDPARLLISVLAGVAVFVIAVELFPHHSANHDEGVYLQQAAMLLRGNLWLESPVPEAVRPWFFVLDGSRLYPKYAPVPAAMFATGLAVGVPRLVLGAVAAANAWLVGALGTAAFDRRTGLLAAVLLALSPMFLLASAVFLPYAPTTFLNLLFALGYVRAVRGGRLRDAVLAGTAVGIAVFARPYTAVLFALPFVLYSVALLAWNRDDRDRLLAVGRSLGVIAILGLAGVAVTLAYNRVVTGDPLLFPYAAFAPLDGIGFGYRRILGHDRLYTPELAVRANVRVLWQLLTRWGPIPPLGTVLAGIGVTRVLREQSGRDGGDAAPGLEGQGRSAEPDVAGGRRGRDARAGTDATHDGRPGQDGRADRSVLDDRTLRVVLLGVLASVAVGNVAFWGNLNVLAELSDPDDGLIALFGPFYHFDALVVLAVFGAAGATAAGSRILALADRVDRPSRREVLAVLVVAASLGGTGLTAAALDGPVERHGAYTDRYEQVYEPFEKREFDRALVFVPTPYGDWLIHPFQSLRNGGRVGGPVVYALDRGPAADAAVLDAYPNRTLYRYQVRGEWTVEPSGEVSAGIERLSARTARRHRATSNLGVVAGAETATVRIAAGGRAVQYGVEHLPDRTLSVEWLLTPAGARVDADGLRRYSDNRTVPVDGPTEVALSVTLTQHGGSTVTYRQELTVIPDGGRLRVLWPPRTRICRLTPRCGPAGTYLPGANDYVAGVDVTTELASE